MLEGSVRKAGGRIRINAQLIDGAADNHVWAERYDRDASDIFALQDEISHAIVKALRLRLLPEEKQAIERRGTESVEAHDLYLMARQLHLTNMGNKQVSETIVRMCTRATEIDPNYAQAWALMALGYRWQRVFSTESDNATDAAAEKALALDPNLAEAHAVKAFILQTRDDMDDAAAEIAIALKLDPESREVNLAAGRLNYQLHRFGDAARYYEKAASLVDSDVASAMMLTTCYTAMGDAAATRRAAEMTLKRADAALARDQTNASVIASSAIALAVLGEGERAKARMNRALLSDPDNFQMRYNFACMLSNYLKDEEAALDMLESVFAKMTDNFLPYAKADPDFAALHDDPRWQAMVAAAEARLTAEKGSAAPEVTAD